MVDVGTVIVFVSKQSFKFYKTHEKPIRLFYLISLYLLLSRIKIPTRDN